MCRRLKFAALICLILTGCTLAWSQVDQDSSPQYSCATSIVVDQHTDALQHLCEFVASLRQRLPNYISDETVFRKMPTLEANSTCQGISSWDTKDKAPNCSGEHFETKIKGDKVTGELTYFEGKEELNNIRLNGKPAREQELENGMFWSTGESVTLLQGIFAPISRAEFRYLGTRAIPPHTALMFAFRIARAHQLFWQVAINGTVIFPGLEGEVWVDDSSFDLLHLRTLITEMDRDFPLTQLEHTIQYRQQSLGDGTSFVLPVHAEVQFCRRDNGKCSSNQTDFTNYRKFAAKSRILPPR